MAVSPARRLFTVDEFHRMGEAGILNEDDRIELIDGELIQMTPIGPRHAAVVSTLTRIFNLAVGGRANVRPQNPSTLDDFSEPQPDLCLAHPVPDGYYLAHPRPDELFLIVEVADSSVAYDRGKKTPRYARAGVMETWVIDLMSDRVETFREPSGSGYSVHQTFLRGDVVSPLAFADIVISVDEILGPR